MAFSTSLMDLQRLPSLSSKLQNGSFAKVFDKALFATIMAIAYVVVLLAIFIALLLRVGALWLMLAFSPLIVAAKILGIDTKGGDMTTKGVSYLIMPLKIAASMAISFVMINGMIEGNAGFEPNSLIGFGNQISDINNGGVYKIMWQILTIIVFWETAFWAFKDTLAEGITNTIRSSAEAVGQFSAESLFYDKKFIHTPNGDFGLSTIAAVPSMIVRNQQEKRTMDRESLYGSIFKDGNKYDTKLRIAMAGMDQGDFNGRMTHLENKDVNGTTLSMATIREFSNIFQKMNFTGATNVNNTNLQALKTAIGSGEKNRIEAALKAMNIKNGAEIQAFVHMVKKEDAPSENTGEAAATETIDKNYTIKNGENGSENTTINATRLLFNKDKEYPDADYLAGLGLETVIRKDIHAAVKALTSEGGGGELKKALKATDMEEGDRENIVKEAQEKLKKQKEAVANTSS
jgi:hypothetical protein